MEVLVLVVPASAALLCWALHSKRWLHSLNLATAGLLCLLSSLITIRVITSGPFSYPWLHQFFYLDALSVIVLDTIVVVNLMVSIYTVGYLNQEFKHQVIDLRGVKFYYSLMYAFIFTMIMVVTTQNLGLIWIAIEATTLASAFLVGFYNNQESLEAAWKYVVICSVGIAFALLGIVLVYFSSLNSFAESNASLNWLFLWNKAACLHSSILKLAFIFILIGFGTKVGLAPMHTWLPDAHSQAPAPISALLSGVLLNSALYGIIRVLIIVNRNLESSQYTGRLLMAIGLLSMLTAAIFMLTQKDYKRLLAYSSIEHMGVLSFGLGIFTPLALFGVLLHLLNHAFTKSLLFLASGNIHLKYRTREIAKVTGLLKTLPFTGMVFLLGLLAIAGLPPFGVFASELNIIMAAFLTNHWLAGVGFVIIVALVFTAMVVSIFPIFFGRPQNLEVVSGESNYPGLVVLGVLLLWVALSGFYLPLPLKNLLVAAAAIIRGGY